MTTTEAGVFGQSEVCRTTGVSYRQLNYWCTQGYVTGEPWNPGTPGPRLFTLAHVSRIRWLMEASRLQRLLLPELAERLSDGRILVLQ